MYSKDYYSSQAYSPEEIGMEIFRKMSQDMPYMVFITKAPDFQLLYANRKVSDFLGLGIEDLQQMDGRLLSMMDKEDINNILDLSPRIQAIKAGDAIKLKVKLRSKEGPIVYLETSISVFRYKEDGTPSEYFCMSEDITEKVMLEVRAQEIETIARTAEDSSRFGSWEWDMLGSKVKWSDGFWDMLEYPKKLRHSNWMPIDQYFQHVGQEFSDITTEMVYDLEKTDPGKLPEPMEITLTTYTGKKLYVVTLTRILEWMNGKPALAVGSTTNITKIKNIQKSLEVKNAELAKAYSEMEEFSYVASHDLQEPLRKITAFGERLKAKCGQYLLPDCELYLDRIMDGANRMRILIENLLALPRTKRNADHFRPTDLNKIVADVLVDLEESIAQKSAIINHSPLPTLDAIPTQMHQLFLNILANSLKFTKENSPAIINISHEPLTEKQKNEYNLDLQQEYTHILFRDNGIGFDNVYADTIFTPFKRLHGRSEYEGTGIGLTICKKVVQNHLGAIWAESNPGDGAIFHIVLAMHQFTDEHATV